MSPSESCPWTCASVSESCTSVIASPVARSHRVRIGEVRTRPRRVRRSRGCRSAVRWMRNPGRPAGRPVRTVRSTPCGGFGEHLPHPGGTAMAEQRTLPTQQKRGAKPLAKCRRGVSRQIDAGENALKPAAGHPPGQRPRAETAGQELLPGEQVLLRSGKGGETSLRLMHATSPLAGTSALWAGAGVGGHFLAQLRLAPTRARKCAVYGADMSRRAETGRRDR